MTSDDDRSTGLRPGDLPALAAGTRLLHIGPHKTGSSAVQNALHHSREDLARHGVHYAGRGQRPRRAGWSIGLPGQRAGAPRPSEWFWDDLVADITGAGEATVCVSNEDFSRAGPAQRERIVGELGQGRHHVVAAARPLHTFLPSLWQERAKAGVALGWEDWLRIVLTRGKDQPFHFERANVWRAHDVRGMVERWSEAAGADRITVVVLDGRDHRLLPHTLERLLGLPEELLAPPEGGTNRGLAWSETEAVRSLHGAFDRAGFDRRGRDPWMADGVVAALAEAVDLPVTGPRRPPFPAWAADTLHRMGEDRAAALAAAGVRVVGDAAALRAPADLEVGDADMAPPISQQAFGVIAEAFIAALSAPPASGHDRDDDASSDDD